jgi:hypothetical protein
MLTKADIAAIAGLAKIPVDTLQAAIDAKEESAITLPAGLESYLPTELKTLKDNEYNSGKVKGIEMLVKDTKEAMKLEFTGKTIDGLIKAAQDKALADAGKTVTEKEKELNDRITTLQGTVTEITGKLTMAESRASEMSLNGELWKHIPQPVEGGVNLGNDAIITLMKADGYSWKNEGGQVSTYLNGALVQDKLSNAKPAKEIFPEYMKSKGLITDKVDNTPGGRGGKGAAGGGGKAMKLSELKEEFVSAGKSLNGAEFNDAVTKARADNKDFDLHS